MRQPSQGSQSTHYSSTTPRVEATAQDSPPDNAGSPLDTRTHGSVPGVGGVLPDQHGGAVAEDPVAGMKEAIGG